MENIISGIFSILIGFGCLWLGRKMNKWTKRIKGWKQVQAKLISKKIGERKILQGTELNNYRIYIEYEFTVDGKTYHGNILNMIELEGGEQSMLMTTAERNIKKITDPISVYYDPQNPERSLAHKGSRALWFALIIVGILMILIGTAVTVSVLV